MHRDAKMWSVRTTIELPDDLYAVVRQLAHDRHESMSEVAVELIRRGACAPVPEPPVTIRRGVPIITVGRPVTAEDVASLGDG